MIKLVEIESESDGNFGGKLGFSEENEEERGERNREEVMILMDHT